MKHDSFEGEIAEEEKGEVGLKDQITEKANVSSREEVAADSSSHEKVVAGPEDQITEKTNVSSREEVATDSSSPFDRPVSTTYKSDLKIGQNNLFNTLFV